MAKAGWVNRYHFHRTEGQYGFTVTEQGNSEWELAVFLTGRQDFQTSYGVILTTIDGLVRVQTGLVPTEKLAGCILGEIGLLIKQAGWTGASDLIDMVGSYLKKFYPL
jgi:hypothetical protein